MVGLVLYEGIGLVLKIQNKDKYNFVSLFALPLSVHSHSRKEISEAESVTNCKRSKINPINPNKKDRYE